MKTPLLGNHELDLNNSEVHARLGVTDNSPPTGKHPRPFCPRHKERIGERYAAGKNVASTVASTSSSASVLPVSARMHTRDCRYDRRIPALFMPDPHSGTAAISGQSPCSFQAP